MLIEHHRGVRFLSFQFEHHHCVWEQSSRAESVSLSIGCVKNVHRVFGGDLFVCELPSTWVILTICRMWMFQDDNRSSGAMEMDEGMIGDCVMVDICIATCFAL